jgi:hypothetical protein
MKKSVDRVGGVVVVYSCKGKILEIKGVVLMSFSKKVNIFEVHRGDVEVSRYIEENYLDIVRRAESIGYNSDIVNDVYIAIKEREANGIGYDPNKGLSIEEYFWGMVKKFSRNKRYAHDGAIPLGDFEVSEDDSDTEKGEKIAVIVAMASYDDLDAVIINEDLRRDIKYLVSIEVDGGISMRKLLRNLLDIAEMEDIPELLFKKFRKLDEKARDALKSVIRWALGHPDEYKELLAAMGV